MERRKNEYLSDKHVTSVLLRDMKNNKVSNELADMFMKIQERIMKRPNFSGYYAGLKDEMISEGTMLFLLHWKKFQPYRVKNNYKFVKTIKLQKDGKHLSNKLYFNECLNKYDMLEIHNRTYTVKNCKKIKDDLYEITLFNKLKNNIKEGSDVRYLIPKFDLFNPDNPIVGGFSFLSTFAFTGALNKLKQYKKEEKRREQFLNDLNKDVYSTIKDFDEATKTSSNFIFGF